ncbi:MAG: UvrD-helicase domain-containing protein [Coriobacteriales bacterium]|jgi:ATP-dependent helicase/nuclease subunit A|nr:UvrD-helicase domain-containing protein [Coriobacteriales bacterium]
MDANRPIDQAQRDIITGDIHHNIMVEAAAGSGKTSSLVGRILTMIASGIKVENIVAITFTIKAGEELKNRIRKELKAAIAKGSSEHSNTALVALYERALTDLDSASIGTIHAFCLQIITRFSIAMGVSPAAGIMNDQQLALGGASLYAAVASYLKTRPDIAPVYALLLNNPQTGLSNKELIKLIDLINGNLLALADVDFCQGIQQPSSALRELQQFAQKLGALDHDEINKPEYAQRIATRIDRFIAQANQATTEWEATDCLISFDAHSLGTLKGGGLGSNSWHKHLKETFGVDDFGAWAQELSASYSQPLFAQLLSAIRDRLLALSAERIAAGTLTLSDVIDQTLIFLRDIKPAEHQQLHSQYRHFLIDEFQDTDAAQFEIFLRILSQQAASDTDLDNPVLEPGSLFIVGDPKQAIYHFRGGDLFAYLNVKQEFTAKYGGLDPETTKLTVNFRTLPRILGTIDALFGPPAGLISRGKKALIQPEYVAFASSPAKIGIEQAAEQTVAPLTVIAPEALDPAAFEPDALNTSHLRSVEANDIARYILSTYNARKTIPGKDGTCHPVRYKDFAVLCPSKTEIGFVRESLVALGIPFVIEVKSQVYQSCEVIALLNVLRALAKPGTGAANLVLALRSELFGLSDQELFAYRLWHKEHVQTSDPTHTNSFDYRGLATEAPADAAARAVHSALLYCNQLAQTLETTPVHQLLNRILCDRKQYQSFPELIGTYYTVLQDALEFDANSGGNLSDYLTYIDALAQDKQNKETIFLDDEYDAVSLTNFHQSKGREWPICIIAAAQNNFEKRGDPPSIDTSHFAQMRRANPDAEDFAEWHSDSVSEFKIGKLTTPHYELAKTLEKRSILLAEQARLHYVALTRAQYALVLTMHRKAAKPNERFAYHLARYASVFEDAEKIESALIADPYQLARELGIESRERPARAPAISLEEFEAAWQERVRRSTESSTIVISKHDDDSSLGFDTVLPPVDYSQRLCDYVATIQERPNNPQQFGTVIHRALELSGFSLDAAAQQEALENALDEASMAADDERPTVMEDKGLLLRTLQGVLAHSAVIAAARQSQEVYSELSLGSVLDGKTITAYADLVFKNANGTWTIADYKNSTAAESLTNYYRQLEAYKRIFERATGYTVSRLALVYCLGDTLELEWPV